MNEVTTRRAVFTVQAERIEEFYVEVEVLPVGHGEIPDEEQVREMVEEAMAEEVLMDELTVSCEQVRQGQKYQVNLTVGLETEDVFFNGVDTVDDGSELP